MHSREGSAPGGRRGLSEGRAAGMVSARRFIPKAGLVGQSHPRPAPLTELHQRVEETSDRHQEVGEKHVLQLQLHGRAAAGAGAGGVPPGRRVPAPRPRPPACRPRPASRPPQAPLYQLPAAGATAPSRANFRSVRNRPPQCNFRSLSSFWGSRE